MIKVYFKDLSPRVQKRIKQLDCVDRSVLLNIVPVTTILPEDVMDFMDDYNEYDDEFMDCAEDDYTCYDCPYPECSAHSCPCDDFEEEDDFEDNYDDEELEEDILETVSRIKRIIERL